VEARLNNSNVHLEKALLFTARFGFISRDLFFQMCLCSESHKYLLWRKLLAARKLWPYKSNPNMYFLAPHARAHFSEKPSPATAAFLLHHDSIVAKFFLTLDSTGIIKQFWLERELKVDPLLNHEILGTTGLNKFPDLVLDLQSKWGKSRFALEIERSGKTWARYQQIAHNYLYAYKVDVLLFSCASSSNQKMIEKAFTGSMFEKANRHPVTFCNSHFATQELATTANLLGRSASLETLIAAALKIPDLKLNSRSEKDNNPLLRNYYRENEAG
jgi:hypothetical protein